MPIKSVVVRPAWLISGVRPRSERFLISSDSIVRERVTSNQMSEIFDRAIAIRSGGADSTVAKRKRSELRHGTIALFISASGGPIFQSPNQTPERNAETGPAISVGASPLHAAFSFEKTACAEPRVAHLRRSAQSTLRESCFEERSSLACWRRS